MEILSQTEIIEQAGGWPPALIMILFIITFLIASLVFEAVCRLGNLSFVVGIFLALVLLFLSALVWAPKDTPTGRYEYKVILDETYPATQLYENYEVIGQDGKIWIIQEKESKD